MPNFAMGLNFAQKQMQQRSGCKKTVPAIQGSPLVSHQESSRSECDICFGLAMAVATSDSETEENEKMQLYCNSTAVLDSVCRRILSHHGTALKKLMNLTPGAHGQQAWQFCRINRYCKQEHRQLLANQGYLNPLPSVVEEQMARIPTITLPRGN